MTFRDKQETETSQTNIVINVDGLNQADRAKLDAAIERAGFFSKVRARIHGRIERQSSATYELAATELVLVKSTDSTGMPVPRRSTFRRRDSDGRDVASSSGETAGSSNSGAGDSGAGDSGAGNSGSGKGKGNGKGKGKK